MGVSAMFGNGKKMTFGSSRSIALGPLKVNMTIVYYYMNFFHFTKMFLPILTMEGFYILPHAPPRDSLVRNNLPVEINLQIQFLNLKPK